MRSESRLAKVAQSGADCRFTAAHLIGDYIQCAPLAIAHQVEHAPQLAIKPMLVLCWLVGISVEVVRYRLRVKRLVIEG